MIKIHLNVDFAMWGMSKVTIQKKYGYRLYAFSGARKCAYNFRPLHFLKKGTLFFKV
jgi:hypothetical protein